MVVGNVAGVVGLAQNSDGSSPPLSESALTAVTVAIAESKTEKTREEKHHCLEQNRKARQERDISTTHISEYLDWIGAGLINSNIDNLYTKVKISFVTGTECDKYKIDKLS